ncbi:MAG: hypothetical protein K8S18_02515, partial [Desulfobacula sp.]|nr:hypothetical protein [Desulfobacula sp.]
EINTRDFSFLSRIFCLLLLVLFLCSCVSVPIPLPDALPKKKEQLAPEQITKAKQADVESEVLSPVTDLAPEPAVNSKMPFEDKLFTFSARSVPLKDVLIMLAKVGELNLIIDKYVDVEELVSVDFNNVPLMNAMDEILTAHEYFSCVSGNILRIKAVETRVFTFDYPLVYSNVSSEVGGDMLGSSGESGGSVSAEFVVETKTEDEESLNIWKQIKDILKPGSGKDSQEGQGKTTGLLSETGRAPINPAIGIIVVVDRPKILDIVEDFLNKMELSLGRQVIIEAKIMEVTLNHLHQYGLDWRALKISTTSVPFDAVSNLAGNAGLFTVGISKISSEWNLNAFVDAISAQGDVNTLSSPKLNVINNQSATISIGRVIPYLDFEIETVTSGDVISYKAVPTVSKAQAGVSLGITPQISDQGVITLHIVPVITTQVDDKSFTYEGTTWVVPVFDTRQTSTIARVADGETIVLGGLIQDNTANETIKIPILGDIPFIGKFLFSNQKKIKEKIELVILLTPRIVER